MKFVVLKDSNGRWYWELKDAGGSPVARCAMGFSDKANAISNVNTVRAHVSKCLIVDSLGDPEGSPGAETDASSRAPSRRFKN